MMLLLATSSLLVGRVMLASIDDVATRNCFSFGMAFFFSWYGFC
jgi:hypothetical protein